MPKKRHITQVPVFPEFLTSRLGTTASRTWLLSLSGSLDVPKSISDQLPSLPRSCLKELLGIYIKILVRHSKTAEEGFSLLSRRKTIRMRLGKDNV